MSDGDGEEGDRRRIHHLKAPPALGTYTRFWLNTLGSEKSLDVGLLDTCLEDQK